MIAGRGQPAGTRLRGEVIRLVARLPLDVAADTWLLILRDGPAGQRPIHRGPQVRARDGDGVAGPAVVELAAVDEPTIGIEEEEVERLIEERAQARKEKNWARADEIRDKLAEMSILVEDKPEGTRWRVKTPSG